MAWCRRRNASTRRRCTRRSRAWPFLPTCGATGGRPPPPGDIFGRYLILSGIERFLIEMIRRNPAWLLGLTTAQWFSIAFIAIGVLFVQRARSSASGAPPQALRAAAVAGDSPQALSRE